MPGEKGELVRHRVTSGHLWRSLVENVPGQARGEERAGEAPGTRRSSPIKPMRPSGTNTRETDIETPSSIAAAAENFPTGSILALLRQCFPIGKDRIVSQQIPLYGQPSQELVHVQIRRRSRCCHQAKAEVPGLDTG
ncbi:hypothetical protein BSY240_4752 (plasmid) [Agrobacterium sp. RAC06]|nr:hypothetical protein BSY240_4752 [Agrobacterium sp. RAC06]